MLIDIIAGVGTKYYQQEAAFIMINPNAPLHRAMIEVREQEDTQEDDKKGGAGME